MMKQKLATIIALLLCLFYVTNAQTSRDSLEPNAANRVKFTKLKAKAEKGDVEAQATIGAMYAGGIWTQKDPVTAVKWLRKAAEHGSSDAQTGLGAMYAKGSGVEKNVPEAMKLYLLAAEQGNACGQFNLGHKFFTGDGVPKDYVEAIKWYQIAAEQGFAEAQFSLGCQYANGEGVDKDLVEAYRWFSLASAQGHETAKTYLARLDSAMKKDDVAAAKQNILGFQPIKNLCSVSSLTAIQIQKRILGTWERLRNGSQLSFDAENHISHRVDIFPAARFSFATASTGEMLYRIETSKTSGPPILYCIQPAAGGGNHEQPLLEIIAIAENSLLTRYINQDRKSVAWVGQWKRIAKEPAKIKHANR